MSGGVEELRHRARGSEESSVTSSIDPASVTASVTSSITSSYAEVSLPGAARPVQIVLAKEDHTFELDHEALQEILLSEEVRDKSVVVLSVAGAFRKGKSFLLDFLLRYLKNGGLEGQEWMGQEDEPLTGFSWRGGIQRETTGILMWSKPYIVTLPSTGEEVALLLLDTQGAFDNQSTVKDCATIFALSTMISSVQVYNLSMLIQENDLQHLHLFTEYGRLAMEQSGDVKPFQSLWLFVRDWQFPEDYPYGTSGGGGYIESLLQVSDKQHEELQEVRQHIHACFDAVSCFLMPHPGLKVATSRRFDGRLADIDSEFKEHLHCLAPTLLAPENLIVKKINGTPLTGRGLLECFKVYIGIYQGDELPAPKSMLKATAEANNLTALAAAFDRYNKEMDELCGADKPYLSPEKLEDKHKAISQGSVTLFTSTRKMGGEVFSREYLKKLETQIEEAYESFVKRNESKHILNAYRTPAVLSLIMIVSYLVSSILDMVGIESLSQTAIFGLYIPLLVTALWGYIRYSGEFRELGQMIDNITATIWEQLLQPIYAKIARKGLEQAVKLATKSKKKD